LYLWSDSELGKSERRVHLHPASAYFLQKLLVLSLTTTVPHPVSKKTSVSYHVETARLTAGVFNSTIASCLSMNTSTRLTGTIFSSICCKRPSWVAGGRFVMRIDLVRASATRLRPISDLETSSAKKHYASRLCTAIPVTCTNTRIRQCHCYPPLL